MDIASQLRKLHRFAFLRKIARSVLRGATLRQGFHGGVICLDAVEHSWAWSGDLRYETFDRPLQDCLLSQSCKYSHLLDIGCNVGAMSLSVLLRNPRASALCLDPNRRAVSLLKRSAKLNGLAHRLNVENAAVAERDGFVHYDGVGSVTGHVSNQGSKVPCLDVRRLVEETASLKPLLVKLDVEGYEMTLLPRLISSELLGCICLVVELHPTGFNGIGNPMEALDLLISSGARIQDLHEKTVTRAKPDEFLQLVCTWP